MSLIDKNERSPGPISQGLLERFGPRRVIDTPVSENAVTGAAIGAALAGMRPVVVHPRMDFMFYALDPIMNEAANWFYMNGGQASVPLVVWGIINRGGEQAAQHSQALQAMFAHVPGLKVVMPATAFDAKGLMVAAIQDPNPVIFIDDRWLYDTEDLVPAARIGEGMIRRSGADLTLVAASSMVQESLQAVRQLAREKIDVELIDLRTVKPLDEELILRSVCKTGRLVIADGGWKTCGLAAEIAALASERGLAHLKAPIKRITLPDCPAPASRTLESVYYPKADTIIQAIRECMGSGLQEIRKPRVAGISLVGSSTPER